MGLRISSIFHTRLRLGHSGLNGHLYRIGLRDTPSCTCGYIEESVIHYLLFCPNYVEERAKLFTLLQRSLAPHVNIMTMFADRPMDLTNLLLCSLPDIPVAASKCIFKEVQSFIAATNRFSITY